MKRAKIERDKTQKSPRTVSGDENGKREWNGEKFEERKGLT